MFLQIKSENYKNETPYINNIISPIRLYVELTLQFVSIPQFKEF